MAANTRLLEMDTESRAFIDFLETEAFIGSMAVEPMSEMKLGDLYKLMFQPVYAGTKSFNFQDILNHMTSHDLLRQEGNQWIFPTKAIAVPYVEPPEKPLQAIAVPYVNPPEKSLQAIAVPYVEPPEKPLQAIAVPYVEPPEKQLQAIAVPYVERPEKPLQVIAVPFVELLEKPLQAIAVPYVERPEKPLQAIAVPFVELLEKPLQAIAVPYVEPPEELLHAIPVPYVELLEKPLQAIPVPYVEPPEKPLQAIAVPYVEPLEKPLQAIAVPYLEPPEKSLEAIAVPYVETPEKPLQAIAVPYVEPPEKPLQAIAVPYVKPPEKQLQRRRIAIDPRLTTRNLSRLVESRKAEPLSFLAANLKGYEANAGKLLEKANFPTVVFLSNTGLGQEVADEDLIWSGYSNCRRTCGGGDGDILLYYASHLKVDQIQHLQSEQTDLLWVKLTGCNMFENNKGMKERVLILGNIYGGKISTEDILQHLKLDLEIIKERFGDVDVVVQGSIVNKDGLEELGLVSHEVGDGRVFLTSPAMSFLSVKVLDGKEETGFKAVLAHMAKTSCDLCQVEFRKYHELKEHLNTPRHHRNHCFNLYQRKREEMLKSPHCFGLEMAILNGDPGVEMSPNQPGLVLVQTSPGFTKNFLVSIKNTAGEMEHQEDGSNAGIVIQAIDFLRTDPAFKVTDKYEVSNREKGEDSKKIRVPYGMSYKAKITCLATQRGHYKVPLVVTFYHDIKSNKVTQDNEERFELSHMALEVLLIVQSDDMRELKPQSPYEKPKPIARWNLKNVVKAPRPPWVEEVSGEEKQDGIVELKYYDIPEIRNKVLNHGIELWEGASNKDRHEISKCHQLLAGNLNPSNYRERLELLLQCEEHQMKLDIRHYDMTAVELAKRNQLLELKVPGLLENRPSIIKGDRLFVRQSDGGPKFEAIVHEVVDDDVQLGCSVNNFENGIKFDVRFTVNRLSLRTMHRAINMAKAEGIIPSLFPSQQYLKIKNDLPDIQPMDRSLADNPEQMLAVKHIVAGSSGGAPYLVFGPPGTGKTVTMVEAIKQINRLDPNSRILATAPSNSAADLLASRLIKHVPHSQLLRLHAPSRLYRSIPVDILGVSNVQKISGNSFGYPAVEELTKYRVLVVTLVTAGRLVSTGFPKGHFSHVFIDEAGHATEPEAIIALAGILTKEAIGKTSIVLAGDHKQLGPVLRSQCSIKHGLGVSLLERLMYEEMYSANDSHGYDNRCITKLVRNFRSHEKLLQLPANLFYSGQLEAVADELVVNSLLQWPGLKKKGFPLIFHGIIGQDLREENSPSFFNLEEVCTVVEYIEDLLSTREFGIRVQAKEIGVISPYRRQVQKIRAKLASKHLNDVTVGSVEEFQGQERRVVIISTVRSSPQFVGMDEQHRLGFLRNPKRFNVSITRAKALLIVVGNPHILSLDDNWRALINYAMEEGGYVGCPYDEENDDVINAMATRLAGILDVKEADFDGVSQQTAVEEPQWRAEF